MRYEPVYEDRRNKEGKNTSPLRRKTSLSPPFTESVIISRFSFAFPCFLLLILSLWAIFTPPTKSHAHQFVVGPADSCPSNPFLAAHIGNHHKCPTLQPELTELEKESLLWAKRAEAVRSAFRHAWKGYSRDAFGFDEYHPLSGKGSNHVPGGMGYMIIDALDTMMLMGLDSEYEKCRQYIESLSFDVEWNVSLFETTIRVLGGLLSAHFLSTGEAPLGAPFSDPGGSLYAIPIGRKDHPMFSQSADSARLYLTKAVDLADRLLGAFDHDSGSGIPASNVYLGSRKPLFFDEINGGAIPTSEVTTLQLEFKEVSRLTGDMKYRRAVEGVMSAIYPLKKVDGLVPIFISPRTGQFWGEHFTMGARGDSYYEYLLKQNLQTSHTEPHYRTMYDDAMLGVRKHLVYKSWPSNWTFLGELGSGFSRPELLLPKMDHLVCFFPGMLALGATMGYPMSGFSGLSQSLSHHPSITLQDVDIIKQNVETLSNPWPRTPLPTAKQDLDLAVSVLETCYAMYTSMPTGLAPEIVHFNTEPPKPDTTAIPEINTNIRDCHSLLRPETVESLFVLYRVTGLRKYREYGWNIFQSLEGAAKLQGGGYTNLKSVFNGIKDDKMETFFLSETLKYLYLLFGPDDLLPLDKVVFNTEAHPLPKFTPYRCGTKK